MYKCARLRNLHSLTIVIYHFYIICIVKYVLLSTCINKVGADAKELA
jgi:hypothetical protein